MKPDPDTQISSGSSRVDSVYHTLEWLITAFAGTLVFIFFVMQVYRIPTGSMAETLRGNHFRLRCQQCGYRFDYDFRQDVYRVPENVTPREKLPLLPRPPRCPSCNFHEPRLHGSAARPVIHRNGRALPGTLHTVYKGDQIFVLKSIYQFFEPKRWDVMVFKNPVEPKINYIKRLIAGPGETVQLIDGNVFIDGKIARKPPAVQDELWVPIYDNDFQPARPAERGFNGDRWRQPFDNRPGSRWDFNANGPSVFALSQTDAAVHRARFDPQAGDHFRATSAYTDPAQYQHMPTCSDLMMRFYAEIEPDSAVGVHLSKYGVGYEGWVYADGRMEIVRIGTGNSPEVLVETQTDVADAPTWFRFFNSDHLLQLEFGTAHVQYDLGRAAGAPGTDRDMMPQVELAARGSVRLGHIGLYRDIYYISHNVLRATEEEPFTLKDDEFFVCGDNSPYSLDSRLWDRPGIGNEGIEYRAGVVPREYLIGKAVFVHWPGGWRVRQEPLRWIPNPDAMKWIYGGH